MEIKILNLLISFSYPDNSSIPDGPNSFLNDNEEQTYKDNKDGEISWEH